MPHSREEHGKTGFVGSGDDFVITDRTAGLDDGRRTGLCRGEKAVREGKEGVGRNR